MKGKEGKAPRQRMPEQAPGVRARNFLEVPLGYPPGTAAREAARCIQCKQPRCVAGCPVGIDIPGFIRDLAEGDVPRAFSVLTDNNALPAVCGRVCPQEDQCEGLCILGLKGEPVAIGRLERFVADQARERGIDAPCSRPAPTGKKVAVVGSGPAGLTVAGDLSKLGHEVTVFEALHRPGGVLIYGIPEFRLPKAIVEHEIRGLAKAGVRIVCNFIVGKTATVRQLREEMGFDAVFLGVGAGLPVFLGIPGENANGVYSANEYLTRANLMKAYLFPGSDTPLVRGRKVAVVGGGNVAMDSARTALRMGAEEVMLFYRRSRDEMPARAEEIHHGEEEGLRFHFLVNPVRMLADERGWVRAVECVRMELGEPDASGRRRPIAVKGSEFHIEVDTMVVSVGTAANPVLTGSTPGLELDKRGYVKAQEGTGATSIPGVYAGGDIIRGSATVILAMGDGRRASAAIHRHLMGDDPGGGMTG
jgi:glutamate synthase (NADPH/NADH) small chain